MITLIIIVMIIWAVISACTPDKKNEKKVQEEIQRLPRINLRAKELSGFQKFMNLAYDESSILIDFTYPNFNTAKKKTVFFHMKFILNP